MQMQTPSKHFPAGGKARSVMQSSSREHAGGGVVDSGIQQTSRAAHVPSPARAGLYEGGADASGARQTPPLATQSPPPPPSAPDSELPEPPSEDGSLGVAAASALSRTVATRALQPSPTNGKAASAASETSTRGRTRVVFIAFWAAGSSKRLTLARSTCPWPTARKNAEAVSRFARVEARDFRDVRSQGARWLEGWSRATGRPHERRFPAAGDASRRAIRAARDPLGIGRASRRFARRGSRRSSRAQRR